MFLLVGVLLAAVEGVLPDDLARDLLFAGVASLAVAALLAGVRLHRPARPLPWYLLAGGIVLLVAGDVLFAYVEHEQGGSSPSVADAAYLAGYVLLAGAVLTLVPRRVGLRDHAALLDSLVAGVAASALLWPLLGRFPWEGSAGLPERLVALVYPVVDVVLVAYLVHLVFSRLRRTRSFDLLALAFVALLAGDLHFRLIAALPALEDQRHVEPWWLLAYALWGAAALHPSMRDIRSLRHEHVSTDTVGRMAFLVSAAALLPVVALVERARGVQETGPMVAALSFVMITLIGTRMLLMVRRMRTQGAHLARLADHDFLTGLLSRRRLVEALAETTREVRRGGTRRPAVIVVGLERFTEINDALGHRIGDELLRAIAARLREGACPDVLHARLGGDVFGLLVPDAPDLASTHGRAQRIAQLLREPFVVSELGVDVEASVGVVRAPDHGLDPAALLHRADVALMAARRSPDKVAVYDPAMEAGGALAPELMAELGDALARGEVVVHYQPQVAVATGAVVGVEALVRWQHPVHGLLAPTAFVPAAELTGQIRPLTRAVLDIALSQVAQWHSAGRTISVSVNLSVRNLLDPCLVDDVREALQRTGVPPSHLELEITETSAMVDPDRSGRALRALATLGVRLSIDDYGTGYGSLAYLQHLPIDRLKVDRSFVKGLVGDPASRAIVQSVVELSGRLGLSVVAEGVEDDQTLLVLRDMGCDLAQGFGLARPAPGVDVERLLDRIEEHLPEVLDRPTAPVDTTGAPGVRAPLTEPPHPRTTVVRL